MISRAVAGITVAVAVVLLGCSGLLLGMLGGGGASAHCLPAAVSPTGSSAADSDGASSAPGPIGDWSAEQVGNATVIVAVGQRLQVPARGQVIAVATAMQESSLINLPGGDRDSVGLFQQRPSQGWGTPAQLQDPQHAATKFYTKLLAVPGWQTMTVTAAAQAVQISAYPDAYAKWEPDAVQLVGAVTGTTIACPAAGMAVPVPRNPDGSLPDEQCSIRPDPTTGVGCLTPRTLHLVRQASAAGFPDPSCWRVDDHGEHPQGRACDWMMTAGGEATGSQKAMGDAMAAWAVANAQALGIRYVIWFRLIWTDDGRGWHTYNNPFGGDDPSGWHTNHVHISVN
ncbi:hypothetical protein OHA21_38335 [Actinoplanes sp. NBC_00393]|uniref:hypothetical protein n=1 Tax=Actinoplanes sp. NBC_00393 TaxID=2975953 RepID=UPI002E1A7313